MEHIIRSLIAPIFNYPVQRKPICFYRQKDFASTGEPLVKEEEVVPVVSEGPLQEYSDIVKDFHEALLKKREEIHKQTIKEWHDQMVKSRFSGWDSVTVAYLHSLFLLFDQAKGGTLSLSDFCTLLESLGDDSVMEERKAQFNDADSDMDGRITYDEFLSLMYNFNASRLGILGKLANLCYEMAHRVEFVDSLTIGEQLIYGLF